MSFESRYEVPRTTRPAAWTAASVRVREPVTEGRFSTARVGHGRYVRTEPGGDRQAWKKRLAAIKDELASLEVESVSDLVSIGEQVRDELASQHVESVSDLLRLGEKALTGAGIDLGDRFDAMADDSRRRSRAVSRRATILRAQGAYYVVSGSWAIVDRRGFEAVSGRKADYWLVRTVGLLAASIGISLLAGTRGGRPSSETTVLGVAAGVSFTAVDLVYVARRRISPVYLGDAIVHGLLAGFALLGPRELRRRSS